MGWRTKMRKAKRRHRPGLEDWRRDNLVATFPSFVQSLSDDYLSFTEEAAELPVVLDAKTLSTQDFWDNYEAKRLPCVIHNIPAGHDGAKPTEEWPAMKKWNFFALNNDDDLRNRAFKCGEDDDGSSVRVKLKHFLKYLQHNKDDSPLYIFDATFDEERESRKLLRQYRVPSYFKQDLFRLVSERRRPPYRWILVGPARSGTCVHIDPLATSAWNTLIHGKKRWVLFPPHLPKHVVKGTDLIREEEDDEPIHYFLYILPRIKRKAAASSFCSVQQKNDYTQFACYEFTQHAGETVFIPNGWWHAVLNMTDTVGITQNYCSENNFEDVWKQTRVNRKKLAWKWLCELEERYPHLAQRAKEWNAQDKFQMKYDPRVMEHNVRKRIENGSNNNNNNNSPTASSTIPTISTLQSRYAHLDREWKRCRIEKSTRQVSPS